MTLIFRIFTATDVAEHRGFWDKTTFSMKKRAIGPSIFVSNLFIMLMHVPITCIVFKSPLLNYLKISPTFVFSLPKRCVLDVVTIILF